MLNGNMCLIKMLVSNTISRLSWNKLQRRVAIKSITTDLINHYISHKYNELIRLINE